MTQVSLKIVNEKGLHARASAKLVEVVEAFDARAEVSKDGMSASGDSIMGLLMLAASKGCTIDVQTSGDQVETARLQTRNHRAPVDDHAPELADPSLLEHGSDRIGKHSDQRPVGLELRTRVHYMAVLV